MVPHRSTPSTKHFCGLTAALLSAVVACSDSGDPVSPSPTTQAATIKVAVVLSLSGPAKALGEEAKRGIEVAAAQVNALGGVLNKRIELVVEDDTGDPKVARQKVEQLAAAGITIGIGPSTSTTALELKDLILQDKVVYISPSATSKVLDQLGTEAPKVPAPGQAPAQPVFFRTAATDVFLSAALTQYASNTAETGQRRCASIAVVRQNDTYGQPIAEAVISFYQRLGLTVGTPLDLDPGVDNDQKLRDAAEKAGGNINFKCQVVVAQPEVAARYMLAFNDYRQKNSGARDWSTFLTIGSDGFRQNEFITAGRVDAADTTLPTAGEGSIAIAADTAPTTPEFSAFLNLFKARFPNEDPGRYGSTAYDATILVAAALEATGSAGQPTAAEHKKFRDTLYRISQGRVRVGPNRLADMFDAVRRGQDINYEGASGTLDFSEAGAVRSAFGVWRIVDAKFVKVDDFAVSELGGGL